MAQAREKGGRVVFIGNIPYGISEEMICDIFARVGTVVNFRLVHDKETGKPKGFGFLEYTDVDAAASAVRNLNEYEIQGRTLRVDYSNDNGGGGNRGNEQTQSGDRAPPPAHFNLNAVTVSGQMNGADPAALPPLPEGEKPPPGLSAPDAISRTLSAMPTPQLLDIISQMKTLVSANPAQATALLTQAPQLSYAIFQALLLLGLVEPAALGQLIHQTAAPPAAPPQQQAPLAYQPPPPNPYGQQPAPVSYGASVPQAYAPPAPPIAYAPTPPVQQQQIYQPPPPPPQSVQDPAQQALINQVLSMTREQIFAMAEGPRNQILALRAQLQAPV